MEEKTPEERALVLIKRAREAQANRIDLSEYKMSFVPKELFELNDLEELILGDSFLGYGNNIVTIPKKISKLSNLRILNLGFCSLKTLPKELFSLSGLEELQLVHNNISHIPSEIKFLKNLRILNLCHNPLLELPPEIGNLTKLEQLYLGSTKLKILPNEIGNLTSLEKISLGYCPDDTIIDSSDHNYDEHSEFQRSQRSGLEQLPDTIGNLKNLRSIDLSYNAISEFPEAIGNLINLCILDASGNNIKILPDSLSKLDNLEELFLHNNPIENLPKGLDNLKKLKKINITATKIPIPTEIRSKGNEPHSIFAYYYEGLQKRTKALLEAKILVVGQGSVGKTSLVGQLIFRRFNENELKTDGIKIERWDINSPYNDSDTSTKINLNIWDFGGQEIMHATHQFFLTKRSLYLLVLDSRLTQEENRIEYWLRIIQSFGENSPILIIGNKIDQHPLDIDRTGLQKKYPNIVGVIETSAATGAGIEELKEAITEQVNNLPHVRDLLPESWFTVKTKLEELGQEENFITEDKYLELCAENEVSDETSQRTLIGFLHDLGVVLHFQDDPRLESLGILNPQWVTNGVYKILNSHELFKNKGVLERTLLNKILDAPEYPSNKRLFIVDMMRKFELCYDLVPDQKFLVPDLLPKDEPQLSFKGIPAFEYAYPVLPSSVITRFIVRMNQKIDDGFVWRTGVLLKIGENQALVKADIEDKKITIAIGGMEHTRRDALSAIRYQLDEIHASIKGLNPQKRVPVPNAPNAEAQDYEYLLMLEREGQDTLMVKDGGRLVKVNIREILSGIESEAKRREQGANVTNIYIGGNVEGSNIVSGDNNVITQRIQESFNKADNADIQAELKETLKQLAEAVAEMNKALPEEKAEETADDLEKLVEEATKDKPKKRWYSVSIEGLIAAAKNLDKIGEPVVSLSKKVLSLLTGGLIE